MEEQNPSAGFKPGAKREEEEGPGPKDTPPETCPWAHLLKVPLPPSSAKVETRLSLQHTIAVALQEQSHSRKEIGIRGHKKDGQKK